jgi:hypothetical protein
MEYFEVMSGKCNVSELVVDLPANVENNGAPNNASKGQMGFNLAFRGLMYFTKDKFNNVNQ